MYSSFSFINILVLKFAFREGVKNWPQKKMKTMGPWERVYMKQKGEASWFAGLLKGIRELGPRPLIPQFSLLCQFSRLTLPSHHPD